MDGQLGEAKDLRERIADLEAEVSRLTRLEAVLRENLSASAGLTEAYSDTTPDFATRALLLLAIACHHCNMDGGAIFRRLEDSWVVEQALGGFAGLELGDRLPLDDVLLEAALGKEAQSILQPGDQNPGGAADGLHVWAAARLRPSGVEPAVLALYSNDSGRGPITETERDIVGLMAQWAGGELVRHDAERERRRLLDVVEDERAILRQVITSAPVPLAMFDRELRFLACSGRWVEDRQLSGASILGCALPQVAPQEFAIWTEEFERALKGQARSCDEQEVVRADGTSRFVRWTIQPWYLGDGSVGGVVALIEDVTPLVEAREAALQASKAKMSFLAMMSHEIRTPINGILGMAQLLQKSSLDARQQRYMDAIETSTESLLVILNDILDFSRLEAGKLDFQSVPFNLRLLAEEAVGLISSKADGKGLSLRLEFPGELAGRVIGDPGRTRQLLVNLIDNAVKFTQEGGVTVRAATPFEDRDRVRFRFSVTDTGPGVPEHKREALFEVFDRGDTAVARSAGGSGLGLAICRQLVQLAGGQIGLESEVGKGSTFWFELDFPKQDVQASTIFQSPTRSRRKRPEGRFSASILVVEDNPINQEVTRELAKGFGCTVELAENGKEGLVLASEKDYDAILMDCRMPVMDGLEASRRIRQLPGRRGRVPIIALSAGALASEQQACAAAGMNAFVAKPVTEEALHKALAQILGTTGTGATAGKREAPAQPQAAVLDLNRLNEVTAGNVEFQKRLLAISQEELEGRLAELHAAVAASDFEEIDRLAHRMKGGAENIGAMPIGSDCRALREAALKKDSARVAALAASIAGHIKQLRFEMEQIGAS